MDRKLKMVFDDVKRIYFPRWKAGDGDLTRSRGAAEEDAERTKVKTRERPLRVNSASGERRENCGRGREGFRQLRQDLDSVGAHGRGSVRGLLAALLQQLRH